MPTPAVNGDASIIHFTAGTLQPYSIDALEILRTSWASPSCRVGVKPTSFMTAYASANISTRMIARRTNGTPKLVAWAM